MRDHPLGATGVRLPRVGQGTWRSNEDHEGEVVRALVAGIDAGMTHIDTAELYGRGHAEQLVGKAIAGRRDEVFLVSKVMPSNASSQGTKKACERSLRHLGTDRIDLYLLHWPGAHPLEDTLGAFAELVDEGKIRFFGLSNFDTDGLAEAIAIVGERKIVCNQVLYHLQERTIEHRVLPFCEQHDIAVVGYSPFGSGNFVSEKSEGGKVLAEVGKARDATSRQVALSFLVRRESLLAIPKASTRAHVLDNAGALDLVLTADEIRRIEKAFPLGKSRDLPML